MVGCSYKDFSIGNEKTKNDQVKEKFPEYFKEIEKITQRIIPENQNKLLVEWLGANIIRNLNSKETKQQRVEFNSKRREIIKEWEINTDQKWPKYKNPVIIKGKIVRQKGQNYDAHHIVELSWNGPNIWWNMHPAAYPNEHQNGIHKGICSEIFGDIPDYIKN